MYCQKCGKEIPEGSQTCPNCNTETTNENAQMNQVKTEPTKDNIQMNQVQPYVQQGKSKIAAGLLGIFLGVFGIHNFYLGYTTKAVIQLCITVLTCGIGSVVTIIWGIVEGILILCGSINVDGNGIPLVDGTGSTVVNQYYNNTTINNNQSYQNNFKVVITDIKNEDNMTIIIGDIATGSISVGETARIENTETHEYISCKIVNIIEDGMNVGFTMAKNVTIKIPQIDISNVGRELIK